MLDLLPVVDGICAEVGVYQGAFSREILQKNPQKLYLIDPWKHGDYGSNTNPSDDKFEKIYQRIIEEFGSNDHVTVMRMTSEEAVSWFLNSYFDFVYIDADHRYASCLNDLALWYPKVKVGGWLCGHDYCGAKPGVKRAVNEFFTSIGRTLDLKTDHGTYRSWGVKKDQP